jgi:glycosyltransferase involved in cell wall biosynthesis
LSSNYQTLSLLGCYWPGHEATGPNQSFRALAGGLGDGFCFKVVARDAGDLAETERGWRHDGVAEVIQLKASSLGAHGLLSILRDTPHDLLLLNGFFDREFTIPALLMRKLGLVPRDPVILSPRGEFAGGALSLKSGRKCAYLRIAKALGLLDDVWLHATADHEREDMQALGLRCRGILQAPNVQILPEPPANLSNPPVGITGHSLHLAFLGRVTPVKNVHFALELLARIQTPVRLDIYGPISDQDYWARCEAQIGRLPSHVSVSAKGSLAHERVVDTLAGYDLFFLPTRGENFGHAINEALAAGLPVLISDKTPWTDLEAHEAGWSLSLDAPERFVQAIESFAVMTVNERHRLRLGARRLAERKFVESDAIAANRRMFQKAIAKGVARA